MGRVSGPLISQLTTPPLRPPQTPTSHHGRARLCQGESGELPDISGMSKEDLSALVKQLYDQSCSVFGEKFHMEYAVKKRDMEIHNLEMETSESHGTFKIPKLKKVNKFKMMGDEEEAK